MKTRIIPLLILQAFVMILLFAKCDFFDVIQETPKLIISISSNSYYQRSVLLKSEDTIKFSFNATRDFTYSGDVADNGKFKAQWFYEDKLKLKCNFTSNQMVKDGETIRMAINVTDNNSLLFDTDTINVWGLINDTIQTNKLTYLVKIFPELQWSKIYYFKNYTMNVSLISQTYPYDDIYFKIKDLEHITINKKGTFSGSTFKSNSEEGNIEIVLHPVGAKIVEFNFSRANTGTFYDNLHIWGTEMPMVEMNDDYLIFKLDGKDILRFFSYFRDYWFCPLSRYNVTYSADKESYIMLKISK